MTSFLCHLKQTVQFYVPVFDKYKQYDPYIIQPIGPDFDPIQDIIKLRVSKLRLLRPIQEIRVLNCASQFFQNKRVYPINNTNQHFGIEMYTINKIKGLLFLVAINVITFTFLTVHRAPSFTANPPKNLLCSSRELFLEM